MCRASTPLRPGVGRQLRNDLCSASGRGVVNVDDVVLVL